MPARELQPFRASAQPRSSSSNLRALREQHGLSKADLARAIDKNPASVRRLLTAPVNPELRTVVAIAEALDAEVQIVPRKRTRSRTPKAPQAA